VAGQEVILTAQVCFVTPAAISGTEVGSKIFVERNIEAESGDAGIVIDT